MSTKNQWLLNIAMVLMSWLTLPLLGSRNIKRFFPASILIVLIEILHARIGKKRRWWVFYNKPKSYLFGEFPFDISFLVISMWILKWTYGNFKRFILLNAILNATFAFPISSFSRKVRYYTLVRLNHFQFFLYFFYKAPLLYGFQYFFENRKKLTAPTNVDRKNYVQENTVETSEEEYMTK